MSCDKPRPVRALIMTSTPTCRAIAVLRVSIERHEVLSDACEMATRSDLRRGLEDAEGRSSRATPTRSCQPIECCVARWIAMPIIPTASTSAPRALLDRSQGSVGTGSDGSGSNPHLGRWPLYNNTTQLALKPAVRARAHQNVCIAAVRKERVGVSCHARSSPRHQRSCHSPTPRPCRRSCRP